MQEINYKVSKGRITNLWKERLDTSEIITGIKQESQSWYDCNRGMRGGNGTYRVFGDYIKTALFINSTIYDPPVFEINGKKYRVPERIRMDCYENTRRVLGQKVFGNLAITDKMLCLLHESLCGKKAQFYFSPLENVPKVMVVINLAIKGEMILTDIIDLEEIC